MSTKFFTWTKGDRKNLPQALRTNGVVPIPADCISIKGFDYGRSTKRSNKFDPQSPVLNFEDNTDRVPKGNTNNPNSFALHDAAVQSATNLMAVMNDMLRSPPMSAHLFSQTYPPRLKPMHGRPRSRTAPSTPLVEAPATDYVELPGSFPFEVKPQTGISTQPKAEDASLIWALPAKIGDGLPRPHSTPQNGVHASGNVPLTSSPWLSPLPAGPPPTSHDAFHPRDINSSVTGPTTGLEVSHLRPPSNHQSGMIGPANILSPDSAKAHSLPASLATSRSASANQVVRVEVRSDEAVPEEPIPDGNRTMFEEVANLRKSHDAHIESLKIAHQREISSHRSYIALLENRQTELSSSQGQQVQARIQKAQDNERQLMNTITDLEARLEAANNERTDVLEGYHDACARLRKLTQQDRSAIPWSIPQPRHKRAASEACRFEAATPPLWQQVLDLRRVIASKDVQLGQLQDAAAIQSNKSQEASAKITELEETLNKYKEMLASARADSERYNSLLHHEIRRQTRTAVNSTPRNTPNIEAEAFAVAAEKMVRLKTQRSQQLSENQSSGTSVMQSSAPPDVIERELDHCIKEIIMYKTDAKALRKDLRKAQAKTDSLQTVSAPRRPPTPDGESTTSARSHSSPEITRSKLAKPSTTNQSTPSSTQPGLGITFAERQARSSETVASATAAALLSPTPPRPPSSTTSSPLPRPKTPLGIHKKLPKPPVSPRQYALPISPPPSAERLQRSGTQRSVSESIISSYARRRPGE